MRLLIFGILTSISSIFILLNTLLLRKQLFPALIQITKSSTSLLILSNFVIFLFILLGKILIKIFFGTLRVIEIEVIY
jgi:hypothetical protein